MMAAPLPCLKTAVREKTGRNLATSPSLARKGRPSSRFSSDPETRKFSAPTLPIMKREVSVAQVYLEDKVTTLVCLTSFLHRASAGSAGGAEGDKQEHTSSIGQRNRPSKLILTSHNLVFFYFTLLKFLLCYFTLLYFTSLCIFFFFTFLYFLILYFTLVYFPFLCITLFSFSNVHIYG